MTSVQKASSLATVEQLIVAQQSYLDQILKVGKNYQKLAIPKRTRAAAQNRLESVQIFWQSCLSRHDEILALSTEIQRQTLDYFTTDAFASIYECVEEVRDVLAEALAAFDVQPPSQRLETQGPASSGRRHFVDLPPINLTKFSGDLVSWPAFRDLFVSLVDSRNDLTSVQKLHYLKASLDGKAGQVLRSTEVTAANYEKAWDLLKKRFENPRAIVYFYLDAFLDMPRVSSSRERGLRVLRDQAHDIYHSIVSMSRPINLWEDQFVHIILTKLDPQTRREWELTQTDVSRFPTFQDLDDYLSAQLRALETVGLGRTDCVAPKPPRREFQKTSVQAHSATPARPSCFVCQEDHPLFQCPTFNNKSVAKRLELLQTQERCINCFRRGHRARTCNSKNVCRICKNRHHTLVHLDTHKSDVGSDTPNEQELAGTRSDAVPSTSPVEKALNSCSAEIQSTYAILPTALVVLRSASGRSLAVRALLDQGSQASFIAESAVQMLKPVTKTVSVRVSGIGAKHVGRVTQVASLTIEPRDNPDLNHSISAFVLPKLSSYVPPPSVLSKNCAHLEGLPLADTPTTTKTPVQLILGADYFGLCLREGLIRGPPGAPIAQLTIFGWILSGNVTPPSKSASRVTVNHVVTNDELHESLGKFWELEEIPTLSPMSAEERQCEEHFTDTHTRNSDGRYVVRLPFKTSPPIPLGDTRHAARSLYLKQEARLSRSPELGEAYQAFLREYLALGHMQRVPTSEETLMNTSYLPHHPVVKASSSTTKVRVVFNASFRSDNNSSLNDFLHIGPKLQSDLFALILRWRSHPYVLATDIEKMFRQIIVHPADTDFQRIYWRPTSQDDVQSFRLCTVTYGTACAPYLANRVISQLTQDEGSAFPLAAPILKENVYVDDIMFGSEDLSVLQQTQFQLARLLMAGGFRAHKWVSNYPPLLQAIPEAERGLSTNKVLNTDPQLKVLGIYWEPVSDVFSFKVAECQPVTSKRAFLAVLARIFDPHGWVAPVTITGKILLQQLWLRQINWDEPIPHDLASKCTTFVSELYLLNQLTIPRWTGQRSSDGCPEIHGFCDASNAAYSAIIYLRVPCGSSPARVSLVYAKTKVAPLKLQSIPRLELCAAALLVRALQFVIRTMHLDSAEVSCWTDSSVVLAWLQSPPSRWKLFVANRVSEIQTAFPNAVWRHVPTESNPADCASRGISSSTLLKHPLWWTGPHWLGQSPTCWPYKDTHGEKIIDLEARNVSNYNICVEPDPLLLLSERTSRWPKLLRITAYILRFVSCARRLRPRPAENHVIASEIREATYKLCKLSQRTHFAELSNATNQASFDRASKALRRLNLFKGTDGLLRVGGRLRNADIDEQEKFPILIPKNRIAELIVRDAHSTTLHGGVQVTLRFVRQKFWILGARTIVKQVSFKCVVCARQRATLSSQRMGDLPSVRVNPSRPFACTGVDYAGPFLIRTSKGRGVKTHKAYCVIFVCLAVRAVHLECADDYTTSGFLAAFDRFVSRRGLPAKMYSDNGSNFIGAEREIASNFRIITRDPLLQSRLAADCIEWNFIPPAAPQFGGLWEAGVKCVKFHLKRIMGTFTPSFEEFATLLCKIEGILNSRPIAPLYDDPESYDALTPGHFLTGSYLKTVPTPSVLPVNENRLSRWQSIQRFQETFWKVWSSDYLNSLQQRVKWHATQPNLQVGDLVVIRSPLLPPTKWELGRISKCFPGSDNLVRVVLVRTARSEYKRPVTQLVKLPVDSHPAAGSTSNQCVVHIS